MSSPTESSLRWVRVDTNIAQHDKILAVIARFSDRNRGKAIAFSFVCALAYAAGNGTNGLIPFPALMFLHANKADMDVLVEADLLVHDPEGWRIKNYEKRQPTSEETREISMKRSSAANKGNCVRWHGAECGCWQEKDT